MFVQAHLFPPCYDFRLNCLKTGFHGELSLGKVERVLPIGHAVGLIVVQSMHATRSRTVVGEAGPKIAACIIAAMSTGPLSVAAQLDVRAVFFDVDFTLIYPGPMFDGEGYRQFASRHGMQTDPTRFTGAVAAASVELDRAEGDIYRPELFIRYARRVLDEMGGHGPGLESCAREIYDEWARCQHFALYEDVRPAMKILHAAGFRIGLISNTHRCLTSFQSHFELDSYISGAVSSSDHGYMKPHPSIFEAALRLVGVGPSESVMVGDSLTQDILGARSAGMGGVLIERSAGPRASDVDGVPVIRALDELPNLLNP